MSFQLTEYERINAEHSDTIAVQRPVGNSNYRIGDVLSPLFCEFGLTVMSAHEQCVDGYRLMIYQLAVVRK